MLGIPAIYDRVCQQALLNRLEPIFEPVFDDASYGYRRGRSTKDALRKIWKEIQGGSEWAGGSPCAFQSARRACMTSMRAARAAGSQDATTAAASSTNAERITGKAPGIFTSKK